MISTAQNISCFAFLVSSILKRAHNFTPSIPNVQKWNVIKENIQKLGPGNSYYSLFNFTDNTINVVREQEVHEMYNGHNRRE